VRESLDEGKKGIIVCKIGGSIVEGIHPTFIADLKSLRDSGARVVLVHGGGDQVTEIAEKLGKKQRFIKSPDGISSRYTDKETAEIFTMVMSGLVAKRIVQSLGRDGIEAVSLTGLERGMIRAERKNRLVIVDDRGRKLAIDGGYTGKISEVRTGYVETILDSGAVPVISPVAASLEWDLLNVDGDRACSHVAGAMGANAAVFLTDVEGLLLGDSVVSKLTAAEAREAVKRVGAGMDKKLIAAAEAVERGAGMSVISSGLVENPLSSALARKGTVITP
jgi:acetylglutamate/LysW-gamma-L-alpha-aminoadipate kinase